MIEILGKELSLRKLLYIITCSLFFIPLLVSSSFAEAPSIEEKLDAAFHDGELSGLHSVLVIHKGEILAERYYPGADQRWGDPLGAVNHNASQLHDLRSVSKSVTSLLYGIALAEGLVPELDQIVVEQFPEYEDLAADPARRKILIKDVLSMQMGTDWNESLPYTDPRNSEIAMEKSSDRYRYVLDRAILSEPGQKWVYNGGATAIIARLIEKGAGKPIDVYAREKLFTPLGIGDFEWVSGRDGVPSAASGLRLNNHDLAKLGLLIVDKGVWQGHQIIPVSWLERSFKPEAFTSVGLRYGLFWWLAPNGSPPYWAAGFGNGGQRLLIDEANQLVMVIFAGNYNQPNAWQLPVKVITKFVLPVVLAK